MDMFTNAPQYIKDLQKKVDNFTATKQDKREIWRYFEKERKRNAPPKKPCEHEKITVEFMGGGFLRTCDNCGKII